jgi:hypothetical protein
MECIIKSLHREQIKEIPFVFFISELFSAKLSPKSNGSKIYSLPLAEFYFSFKSNSFKIILLLL